MEIRGLGTGLGVFHVELRIFYRTKDGYDGVKSFPTMYTVGGTEEDAIKNAIEIHNPRGQLINGETLLGWRISAVNANPDSIYRMVTHCAHRVCDDCGVYLDSHQTKGHRFRHSCPDRICKVISDPI